MCTWMCCGHVAQTSEPSAPPTGHTHVHTHVCTHLHAHAYTHIDTHVHCAHAHGSSLRRSARTRSKPSTPPMDRAEFHPARAIALPVRSGSQSGPGSAMQHAACSGVCYMRVWCVYAAFTVVCTVASMSVWVLLGLLHACCMYAACMVPRLFWLQVAHYQSLCLCRVSTIVFYHCL